MRASQIDRHAVGTSSDRRDATPASGSAAPPPSASKHQDAEDERERQDSGTIDNTTDHAKSGGSRAKEDTSSHQDSRQSFAAETRRGRRGKERPNGSSAGLKEEDYGLLGNPSAGRADREAQSRLQQSSRTGSDDVELGRLGSGDDGTAERKMNPESAEAMELKEDELYRSWVFRGHMLIVLGSLLFIVFLLFSL